MTPVVQRAEDSQFVRIVLLTRFPLTVARSLTRNGSVGCSKDPDSVRRVRQLLGDVSGLRLADKDSLPN